jgi:lipid II:glycine glycyltransferase (peptidoglycan interpeptide bridge formation enzyme)
MGGVIQNITNHKKIFIDMNGNQYNSIQDLRAGKPSKLNKEEQIKLLKEQLNQLENEK